MSWLITLEALLAQEDNLYQAISLQEKKSARNNNNILNRHLSRRRSRPQQNWQNHYKYRVSVLICHISELQFCSLVRTAVAVLCAGLEEELVHLQQKQQQDLSFGLNISWLGFGTSDQYFVFLYPWGEMCYSLFGYLAQGLLPEEFSVKVKVLGGRLRPMVG